METKESVRKNSKRSHRAQFPTPGFYLFAFILNLVSLPLVGFLLWNNLTNITLLSLAFLSVLGVGISIYSGTLRPKESNKKARKILVASTAAYGFILLAVQGLNIVLG